MNPHLQQFTRQLAAWTQEIILRGRTPFRRVDAYPTIQTDQGTLQIPLIFWINRQSLMAGGLILLPEDNLDQELERGRIAAETLGLQHFVTWERNQVRIWLSDGNGTREQQSFVLENPDHPETFHFILDDLLDALKLTAVQGMIPAADLSPSYFNNLFHITLEQTLPVLTDAYRSHRTENLHQHIDIDYCADEENRLTLLRLLSLLWFEKMPASLLPEKLEAEFRHALRFLPGELARPLSLHALAAAPPLPLEAAVAFHHLLLRLRQLSWGADKFRSGQSLLKLARSWFPAQAGATATAAVYIHPTGIPFAQRPQLLLSTSPALIGMAAILQYLEGQTDLPFVYGNTLELDRLPLSTTTITARLIDRHGIPAAARNEIGSRLRFAWPHRRFKIRTGDPVWKWEFIHLLGLTRNDQELTIEIPREGLNSPVRDPIWQLLQDSFCLHEIRPEQQRVALRLSRRSQAGQAGIIHHPEGRREIVLGNHAETDRNRLLLALELPSVLYRLIDRELTWPTADQAADETSDIFGVYRSSRLYQLFRAIILPRSLTNPPAAEKGPGTERLFIPYPDMLLPDPARSEQQGGSPGQNEIDRLLAERLLCPELTDIVLPETQKPSHNRETKIEAKKSLQDTVIQEATAIGLPNFPEQYFYFLAKPILKVYRWSPPLVSKSQILGHFVLEDAAGAIIEGEGDELKQALLLLSQGGESTVELPEDREQLTTLLNLYQKDLRRLYKQLKTICFTQLEDAREAKKALKKAWRKLNLPEPGWFKN